PRQSSPPGLQARPRLDGSGERQCDTSREAGMEGATVALADATRVASGMRIAIAVFEGAEELDFVGPWEVLGAWRFLYPDDAASGRPLRRCRRRDHGGWRLGRDRHGAPPRRASWFTGEGTRGAALHPVRPGAAVLGTVALGSSRSQDGSMPPWRARTSREKL